MHRHRLAAVATALVLWMGAAPHLAEGEQQTRRRGGRTAAAAAASQQRSAPRARPPAARRAPARPPAVERVGGRPRAGSPASPAAAARRAANRARGGATAVQRAPARSRAGNPASPAAAARRAANRTRGGATAVRPQAAGRAAAAVARARDGAAGPPAVRRPATPRPTPRGVRRLPSTGGDRVPAAVARRAAGTRDRGVAGTSRTVRGAVRRPGESDRPATAAPDRAAVRVRRTADAADRGRVRRPEAGGQRRPGPTVDQERRRAGDRSVRRAVPRPPRGFGIGPGGREQRGRDREYRRGREQRGRDREYRGGRDHRRGYGRRWGRGQRPGYWYGYDFRRGYGYHRLGPRYRQWYAPYTHVHYPGYRHGHVFGTSFFAPGLSFAVGYGLGSTAHWYRGYAYYDPHGYGYYGGYAYNPTDLHTGFLRLKVRPRSAQVFVDGYFVGVVNEFDGVFQRLRLEEGPHRVEIVHPGFEPLELDVLIVPGEKVTFEGDLVPLP